MNWSTLPNPLLQFQSQSQYARIIASMEQYLGSWKLIKSTRDVSLGAVDLGHQEARGLGPLVWSWN